MTNFPYDGFIIKKEVSETPYEAFRRFLRYQFPGESFLISCTPDHTYKSGHYEFDIPGRPLKVQVLDVHIYDNLI